MHNSIICTHSSEQKQYQLKQEAQLMLTNPMRCMVNQSVRSPNLVSFDISGMVSYYCATVTLSVRCTVFEIFDFKNAVTLKTGLGVHRGRWKCHHSIEHI